MTYRDHGVNEGEGGRRRSDARMVAADLSEETRDALLMLGGPEDAGILSESTRDELVRLGLLARRGHGHFDLSDLGEEVYDILRQTPRGG